MSDLVKRREDALAQRQVAVRALARLVAVCTPGEQARDLRAFTGQDVDPALLLLALAVIHQRSKAVVESPEAREKRLSRIRTRDRARRREQKATRR